MAHGKMNKSFFLEATYMIEPKLHVQYVYTSSHWMPGALKS